MSTVDALDLNGESKIDIVIYNSANGASGTGISSGNAANQFTYQYAYWGDGKMLATAAAPHSRERNRPSFSDCCLHVVPSMSSLRDGGSHI
jgi:hypothetical protein